MSTTSRTVCDMCGALKPDDYKLNKGWMYVSMSGEIGHKDYCPPCWRPVDRILLRSFVDGLMLQAVGVTVEEED